MFSLERILLAAAALSLMLFAGCRTAEKQTAPMPATPPPAVHRQTNAAVQLPPDSGDNLASNILAWDATEKVYHVQPGDLFAPFDFSLTNVSPHTLTIYDTSTTCDCTVAALPSKPWVVPSGGTGEIHASIDLRKNTGSVTHQIVVFTSKGNRRLTVKAIAPESNAK